MNENTKLVLKGLGLIISPILIGIVVSTLLPLDLAWIGLLILTGVLAVYVFYSWFAPRGIFTVIMKPATAMFVGLNGQLSKELICGGKEKASSVFGGWRVVGVYPFHQILPIKFEEWYTVDPAGRELIIHPPEVVNAVSLKTYSYGVQVTDAETAITREPLSLLMVVVAHISNPETFVFGVKNPITTVTKIIEAKVRAKINQKSFDEILTTPKDDFSEEVKQGLEPYFSDFKKNYGITVEEIRIINIKVADEQANKEKFLATMKKEVRLIELDVIRKEADTKAYQQSMETMGAVKMAFLNALGFDNKSQDSDKDKDKDKAITEEDLQRLRRENPELWKRAEEFVFLRMKVDGQAYVQIEGTNGQSINPLVEMIAASNFFQNEDVFGRKKAAGNQSSTNGAGATTKESEKRKKEGEEKKGEGKRKSLNPIVEEFLEKEGLDENDIRI
jgi:hypothetical protein